MCQSNTIYSAPDMRKYNQKVNDVEVCEGCYVNNLLNELYNRRSS